MSAEEVKDKSVGDMRAMSDRERLKQIIEGISETERTEPTIAAILYSLQFLDTAHQENLSMLGVLKMLRDVARLSESAPGQIRQQGMALVRNIKDGAGGAVGLMMREAIIVQERKLDRQISADEAADLFQQLGQACKAFEQRL